MKKLLSIIIAILMLVTMIPFTPIAFAAEEMTVLTEFCVYEDDYSYPGGWSNDSEENYHLGIQDEGKTAWAEGDELLIIFDEYDTDTWERINTQTALLRYENEQFNGSISFVYDENSYIETYGCIGKGGGTDEYINIHCEIIDNVLYIVFPDSRVHYSRLRIVGEANTSYDVTVDGFFTADNFEKPITQNYTLTTDNNGNAYLYGIFNEGAILSVNGVACTLDYCNGTESEKSYAVCAVHNFSDGCCTECYVKCAHANCSNTVCNDCGYICIHSDTIVQVDAKAPTCTEIGWNAYEYCTACDYTTYVELPASGHTASPTYAPTADGSQHVATYSCCGYESNENHSFETGTCTGCGASWFAVSGNTVTIDGTLGGKTTATEDDIITLLDAIKGYVESGITTIIVTGSDPAIIHLDYGNWVFDMPAVSEALYRLTNEDSRSPYCGTIDLILPDVTEILDDEFNNSFAIKSLTIPKVTTVGDSAFYATVFLETITFGSVVTTIEQKSSVAFAGIGNEVGGCDLVLNCAQLQAEDTYKPELETNVWYKPSWGGGVTWKSITLTHNGGEATCIAKAVCETCGEEYGEFDANKHTLVQKDAKAPTCTEIGWDAYESCTECDYTTYVEIPAIPHIDANCDYKCDYNCGYVYETPDFSDAKVLSADADGYLYIDGQKIDVYLNSFDEERQLIPSGKYKLEGDIAAINCTLGIKSQENVIINLDGYKWTFEGLENLLLEGELSIYDLSEKETGKLVAASSWGVVNIQNEGAVFNLYSGTLESINTYALRCTSGTVNLYGGKIKGSKYAISYRIDSETKGLNIYDTVIESGDGYEQISCYDGAVNPENFIDVSDYTGDYLAVKFSVTEPGKHTVFEGVKNAEEAEKYSINVVCDEYYEVFFDKTEYDEATGEISVYAVANAFTQQPSADNNFTVDFNNPAATFQWYEYEESYIGTYTAEEFTTLFSYDFKAGDILVISTDSELRHVVIETGIIDTDYEYIDLDEYEKTATITFDADTTVDFFVTIVNADNPVEINFTLINETKLDGETEKTLQKVECGKSYYCKATVGENVYISDTVNILPVEHDLIQVDAKAPTCTEIGWEAYEYCTACDYTTYVELPADPDAHTPLEAVKENEVAPKCDVAGSYDLVVYCDDCGAELDRDTKTVDALKHSFTKYEVTEEAKCGVEGKEVAYCDNGCGETDEKAIEALTHTDADGDYKCDNGCGHEFEKPAPEEPTPDTPDEPTDSTCDHLCHKSGILGFFWKIVKFFSKLFKINPVCECGAAHY